MFLEGHETGRRTVSSLSRRMLKKNKRIDDVSFFFNLVEGIDFRGFENPRFVTDVGRAGANAAREPSSIQFRVLNNNYRKCTQVFQDGQGKNTSTCCKHGQQGL